MKQPRGGLALPASVALVVVGWLCGGLAMAAEGLTTIRVEGPDTPGSCSRMANAIADAGISMRGLSSMTAGKNFVAYIGLDSAADADAAIKALKNVKTKAPAAKKKKLARA